MEGYYCSCNCANLILYPPFAVTDNLGTIGWIARQQVSDEPVICGCFHVFLSQLMNAMELS